MHRNILIVFSFSLVLVAQSLDCSNFNGEFMCSSGQATTNPPEWEQRSFQTPLRSDPNWTPAFQDLGRIMCHSHVTYNQQKTSAKVEILCRKHSSVGALLYNFNNEGFISSNIYQATTSFTKILTIKVADETKEYNIELEEVDFIWNNPVIVQPSVYMNGQKGAIVELFGWPYEEVQKECPAIAKMGWMGIKLFPPSESVISYEWAQNGELNPWWFLYQPVSYKLTSRMGTRAQLREMIKVCRQHGVRVYADAAINHMSGGGNDVWPSHRNGNSGWCSYWGPKNSTAHSPFFTHCFMYQNSNNTGLRPGLEFPSVPYVATDFHCERSLNSWTDPFLLGNGWLNGLTDLDTEKDYVRKRIADYLTDLLSIGFSGFRIDAAKHIKPESIASILYNFKQNLGGGEFPDDFITYLEVIIGGEKDLLVCSDNFYSYGKSFELYMEKAGLSYDDIQKVKIWSSDYPKEFPICGYWSISSTRYAISNDCHDDQVPGSSSRDMGDKGSVLIITKDVNRHRNFEVQLFSRNDGNWNIKIVLSSYSFKNGATGFPDGQSDCAKCVGSHCNECTKSMPFSQAYKADSCGYDCEVNGQWVEGVYTRVHRDTQIIQAMRKWQGLPQVKSATELGLSENCMIKDQEVQFLQ